MTACVSCFCKGDLRRCVWVSVRAFDGEGGMSVRISIDWREWWLESRNWRLMQ